MVINIDKLSESEKQVLITFFTLQANKQDIIKETIVKLASEYFLGFKRSWAMTQKAITGLYNKNLISKNNSNFFLTEEGNSLALRICIERPKIWYWYNDYFKKTEKSQTHEIFRKKLFNGENIHAHSSTNLSQIESIIDFVNPGKATNILELGCGDGSIAEYISDKTGAYITGMDNCPMAVKQARKRTKLKRDKLKYDLKT